MGFKVQDIFLLEKRFIFSFEKYVGTVSFQGGWVRFFLSNNGSLVAFHQWCSLYRHIVMKHGKVKKIKINPAVYPGGGVG